MADMLYPTSRAYLFDEVSERIVRELEKRDFHIKGINVEFHQYGYWKYLNKIIIPDLDVYLKFGRIQGRLTHGYNNTAAIEELGIKKKLLLVFSDYSGPLFYTYVGNNWEKDRNLFFYGLHTNSKLNGEKRTYLSYSGSQRSDSPYYTGGNFKSYLVNDTDGGREYAAENDEPRFYQTLEIFREYQQFLHDAVLPKIIV